MNLVKDNSGNIARTKWHLLSYEYHLQLYGFHYVDKLLIKLPVRINCLSLQPFMIKE